MWKRDLNSKVVIRYDTKQLKDVQKQLDRLCRTLEKANSLCDELASKDIEIGITSELQKPCRSVGRRCFLAWLQKILHNKDT